jgi:hypothetical protein
MKGHKMHPATVSALAGIFEMIRQAVRSAEGILASDAGYRETAKNGHLARDEAENPNELRLLREEEEKILERLVQGSFEEARSADTKE